jgi:hypothetical protein
MLEEFVLLKTFREQFKEFLQGFNLPTAICDEDSRWHKFLESYAGIIEDGSLSCRAKGHKLKYIREVIFKKGRPANKESYLPFRLSWNIILLDGRTMAVDIQAGQYGGAREGISNVISLARSL